MSRNELASPHGFAHLTGMRTGTADALSTAHVSPVRSDTWACCRLLNSVCIERGRQGYHIASSLSIEPNDLELNPFDRKGGLGRFYEVFGEAYEKILDEMNIELVA